MSLEARESPCSSLPRMEDVMDRRWLSFIRTGDDGLLACGIDEKLLHASWSHPEILRRCFCFLSEVIARYCTPRSSQKESVGCGHEVGDPTLSSGSAAIERCDRNSLPAPVRSFSREPFLRKRRWSSECFHLRTPASSKRPDGTNAVAIVSPTQRDSEANRGRTRRSGARVVPLLDPGSVRSCLPAPWREEERA